jgi:hypothetical protein
MRGNDFIFGTVIALQGAPEKAEVGGTARND